MAETGLRVITNDRHAEVRELYPARTDASTHAACGRPPGYAKFCSRPVGHAGMHVAYMSDLVTPIAMWLRDD